MQVAFNNGKKILIRTIFLDLNGTLCIKGKLVKGVAKRINKLKKKGIELIVISGNQRGNAHQVAEQLGINSVIAKNASEKAKVIMKHGASTSVAIGNARIDSGMFKKAALAVATLQNEGIHPDILKDVDILIPSINDALDLFIDTNSLEATMKE